GFQDPEERVPEDGLLYHEIRLNLLTRESVLALDTSAVHYLKKYGLSGMPSAQELKAMPLWRRRKVAGLVRRAMNGADPAGSRGRGPMIGCCHPFGHTPESPCGCTTVSLPSNGAPPAQLRHLRDLPSLEDRLH